MDGDGDVWFSPPRNTMTDKHAVAALCWWGIGLAVGLAPACGAGSPTPGASPGDGVRDAEPRVDRAVACGEPAGTAATTNLTLDGNTIGSDNRNGLTFKGFGVLSANGTSALLMDYKAEHPERYAELLQILFGGVRPIMTHVKIEMGNDRNNSTGPDAATMRLESEPANVQRDPGFQLAADPGS
jgi:hypothetical protein